MCATGRARKEAVRMPQPSVLYTCSIFHDAAQHSTCDRGMTRMDRAPQLLEPDSHRLKEFLSTHTLAREKQWL